MVSRNQTTVTRFLLLGFPGVLEIHVFFFTTLFTIYLLGLMGNMVIIAVIHNSYHLRTPMFFLLYNLSLLDIWLTTTTVPQLLVNLLKETGSISWAGCFTQLYFFLSFGVTESFLLAGMAVDRYVAICNPLLYTLIMNRKACGQLVFGCWISGFCIPLMPTILISRLPFCGLNVINHFFCELSPLTQLTCADSRNIRTLNFAIACVVALSSLLIILLSYFHIIVTILRMPSLSGKKKTFSTCASHLTVVSIYYGTIIFMYLRPVSSRSQDLDKFTALFYCIVTPFLNPIIYSLRNTEIKGILKKVIHNKILLRSEPTTEGTMRW